MWQELKVMTIEDIKALIAADESRTLELKKSTGELKDGMHASCAFLNTEEPHDSYPYNVKMAEALYRSMWLENWGSGAKRIIEACQEQGVEEPTWRWDGGFVFVTFKRPLKDSTDTRKENLGGDVVPSTIESKGESSPEALSKGESRGESSSETEGVHQKEEPSSPESSLERIISSPEFVNSSSEQKIIALLREDNKLTLERMAEYLNMTKRGVQKITNRLQSSGQLSRKGSTKAGEWVVTNTKKQQ